MIVTRRGFLGLTGGAAAVVFASRVPLLPATPLPHPDLTEVNHDRLFGLFGYDGQEIEADGYARQPAHNGKIIFPTATSTWGAIRELVIFEGCKLIKVVPMDSPVWIDAGNTLQVTYTEFAEIV